MTLPINIKQWLNNRGIIDEVIAAHKIDWNGSQIVIPIFDINGNFIFNKYRRNPFGPEVGPKYTYDKGATVQLFNAHRISKSSNKSLIICEGELDAMRLESEGCTAISTTGGAGSFKDEWIPLLSGKATYICYDNDEAGLQGAIKLLTKIPAKLILIPREKDVKDVTDFLKNHLFIKFYGLLSKAESYPTLSNPLPELKTTKSINDQIKKYNNYINAIAKEERWAKNKGKFFFHYKYIEQILMIAIQNLEREKRRMQYFKKSSEIPSDIGKLTDSDIMRAKEVPLDTLYVGKLIKGGGRAVGKCPFHTEKTGSFTIFLNKNKFYCFGCNVHGDAIDFVKLRDNVDFITAVKTLINK
jgi:hypothetical protein